jgi:phenylalanyl-tRNA synthetase beta subunit
MLVDTRDATAAGAGAEAEAGGAGAGAGKGKPQKIGTFGVLHPEVLKAYDIAFPSSALEMDLEPLQ